MSSREESTEVVEIDAIAVEEWEHDQHTPMANDSNLAALVKQSAAANSGPMKALDEGWDDLAVPQVSAKPRTTANTLRRSSTASAMSPALTPPKTKTMAFPTALVKPHVPDKRPIRAETNKPVSGPTSVPKSIAPRPPSEAGAASLAAGTDVPVAEAPTAKRPATGTKQPTVAPIAAKRPTSNAAPVVARPAPEPAAKPPATPQKRPTTEAAPILTAKPVAAAPAISKRPTSEPTAKAKPATPVVAPEPAAAAPASPFEAQLSSSDDWLPTWPPAAPANAAPLPAAPFAPAPVPAFEDWDDPNASTAIGNQVAPTAKKRSADDASDFLNESSVIIDLNAAPKAAAVVPKRPQTQPVIQTSEQSTTTSGVFVMPTAAAPNAQQVAPVAPLAPPALASFVDAAAYPERPSNPWQTPLPGPLPGEPVASTASESALDYATPTSASSSRTFVPTPGPIEPTFDPSPAPQWPRAAGLSGYDAPMADSSIPAPVARPEPTEEASLRTPLFTPKRTRIALIAGAGALVAILVVAMAGGSDKTPTTTAAIEKPVATTAAAPITAPTTTPAAPLATPSSTRTTAPAAAVAVAAVMPTTAPKLPAKQVLAKRRFTKTKKPVVVDYDKKPESSELDPDQSLAKARSIYATGNQRLFAGDPGGAITQYRQALAVYPNYAASYRGIGLAYAQQGNKPSALEAFKTYVKLAPTAKDVALIKKRIANLSVR